LLQLQFLLLRFCCCSCPLFQLLLSLLLGEPWPSQSRKY
jgi:hypothetical protein